MANSDTAVTVIEQSPDAVVEWNLDNWPAEQFNRLVPTQTLGLVTDLIRPVVQVVQLDIERDTYESNDLPKGHRAPNVKGLALLAGAAGVDFPDEMRTDDGKDPRRAAAKVWATMVDGAGRSRTVVGSRDYVLDSLPMTDAQRKRAQGHVYEHALTRARHRALRVLLGLAQSYPVAELAKPFAVVSYVPNLQNPELREAYKNALLPTVAAMYGPGAAKQLNAGPEVIDLDKEAADGAEPRNVTPAPATPTTLPGEKIAAASTSTPEEPDWMRDTAAEAKPATAKVDFRTRVRDTAAASDDDELASSEQLASLKEIFAGVDRPLIAAGIHALFDDEEGPQSVNLLQGGQAQAILTVHDSLGHDEFERQWTKLAEKAAVAA